jgi:hypothetical protein
MSLQLLQVSLEQAELSDPPVRAAAQMHIARVLACFDQAAAEQLLEGAIERARRLDAAPDLLTSAVFLAAAVSSRLALPLYADYKQAHPYLNSVIGLLNAMAEHGHIDQAIAYLNDPLPGDRLRLDFVNNLAGERRGDDTRLGLLRVAIRAWQTRTPGLPGPEDMFGGPAFAHFLGRYWNLLPAEEARPVLRDVCQWALDLRSESHLFTLTGNPADPQLGSIQEHALFQLIPALQSLEPELAQRVLQDHPRVAAAMKRFPKGIESVREEQRKFDSAVDDVMTAGETDVVPMPEALATDFEVPFREANARYARDSDPQDPNQAPKECWPSAREFRNILFKAGQHQRLAAAKHLDRVVDSDLRLFAQIELCAALQGLPQLGGVTVERHRPRPRQVLSPAELERMFGPAIPGICCPKCLWTPRVKNMWSCKCGHRWNTFDTRGLCPGCGHQWQDTQCLQCGAMSPHGIWYVR